MVQLQYIIRPSDGKNGSQRSPKLERSEESNEKNTTMPIVMNAPGFKHDHMDSLNRYREYKKFWDKHRIPGEFKDKRMLWTDPGYTPMYGSARRRNASPTRPLTRTTKSRGAGKADAKFTASLPEYQRKSAPKSPTMVKVVVPNGEVTSQANRQVSFVVQNGQTEDVKANCGSNDEKILANGVSDMHIGKKMTNGHLSSSSSSSSSSSDSDSEKKK